MADQATREKMRNSLDVLQLAPGAGNALGMTESVYTLLTGKDFTDQDASRLMAIVNLGTAGFGKNAKTGAKILNAGEDGAKGAAKVANTAIKSADDLLRPSGNLIGTVAKGATPNIRTVSPQEFAKLQSQLLSGAKPVGQYAGGKGTWHELPSGGRVGVRTSDKSGLTLDIDIPGLPAGLKVHQQ